MNLFVRITTRRRRTRAKATRRPPVRLNLDILEDRSLPSVAVAPVFTPDFRVPVPSSSYYSRPDIGVAGAGAYAGTFDVVYLTSAGNATTIEVTRFNADGTPLAAALGLNAITVEANHNAYDVPPRIAVRADGSFVVVYRRDSGLPNLETIAAKVYNADGSLRKAIPNVVSTGYRTTQMYQPAVAIQDSTGNISITWVRLIVMADTGFFQNEVWWRRLDADGNFLSASDQKVSVGPAGGHPEVALVPSPLGLGVADTVRTYDGGIIANSGKEVYFVRFDSSGNRLDAAPVKVNVTGEDQVSSPQVALDASGEFVIVWGEPPFIGFFNGVETITHDNLSHNSSRVMMRRYDKNGNSQSPNNTPETVDNTPGTDQYDPAVARSDDGRFLVSFRESTINPNGPSSNFRDVFRQYSKDGVPVGKKRDFSSSGDGSFSSLKIAASGSGIFGIVASGSNTFARTFREQPPEFFGVATGPNQLTLYRAANGTAFGTFAPFNAYNGGLALAWGDVNGDGIPDLVVTATSGNPAIKVYDGQAIRNNLDFFTNPDNHLLGNGFVHLLGLNIGINVAVGDIEGNGFADIVTAPTAGNPHIQIFSGKRIADDIQNGFWTASLQRYRTRWRPIRLRLR